MLMIINLKMHNYLFYGLIIVSSKSENSKNIIRNRLIRCVPCINDKFALLWFGFEILTGIQVPSICGTLVSPN